MLSDSLVEQFRVRLAVLGLELADLRIGGPPNRPLAQVRIEGPPAGPGTPGRRGGGGGGARGAWPEGGGPRGPRYMLGVSSRGLGRPLRWHRHWVRFVGREVQATVAGLGRVRARIVDVPDERTVVLEPAGREAQTVRLADIRDARLAVDW